MKTDRKIQGEPGLEKTVKKPRRSKSKTNGKSPLINYEHAPIGIVECSLEAKLINANEEFCRLLGYEKNELIGKSPKELTHEDDYPIDIKLHQQLVEGQIPFYRLEKRYIRKDGKPIWVELTRTVVRDAAGASLYSMGVVLDISDRKHAERVLRESVERLRLATEAARMFTWELDLKTEMLTLSDNFEKVIGFSGGLLPKNTRQVLEKLSLAEDVQAFWKAVAEAAEHREDLHSLQFRVIDPEHGEMVWLEANAKILYDENGNPERLLGVAQNVTENKKTQEEILIISRMPEENPNPVMRLTPEGNVLYANQSSAALLKPWEKDAVQTIPGELQTAVREAFVSGLKRDIEVEQDGKVFSATLAPIREAGYVNFYGNDITERKRMEQELARERELLGRLFEAIPVMLTVYEPSTELLRLNSQFERLTGWSNQEAAGTSLMEACYPDPDYRERVWEFMDTCAEDQWMDIRMQTRDGRTLETSWSNIRLSDDMQVGIGIDITERKRTERALQESARQQEALYQLTDQLQRTHSLEDVFNAALDAILDALQCDRASILLFDEKGVMSFVAWRGLSDAYRQATNGHTPWTMDTTNPQPIPMPDVDNADLNDSLKAVIKSEGIGALAFIPLVANGKLIGKFMTYYNAPHVFEEEEVDLSMTIAGQLAFGVDRQRAETALAREREVLNRLFETMPVMVSMYDPKTQTLRLNAEFERRIGWKTGEVTVASLLEFIYPDPAYRSQVVQRLSAAGRNEWVEVQVQTRDGHTLDSIWSNISILNDRYIGIGVDITERKRAEEQLRESEEKYRRIVETASEGIWEIDKDTRTLFVNVRMAEMLGYTPDEMLGRSSFEFLSSEDYSEGERRLNSAKGGVTVRGHELRYRRKDGSTIWLISSNTPKVDAQGNFLGAFAMMTDVTERKQAEQRLILLTEISELVRTLENPNDLLYAVSEAVGEHLQVKRCLFNEIDLENDIEIVHRDYCRGVPSVAGVHKVSEYSSITTQDIAAGKTIVNTDSKTDPRTAQDYERTYGPNGERAYIAVPLMREHRWVASLWVSDDRPRQWSPEEVSLLEAVAERTWTVIEKLRIAEELRAREAELEAIITQTPFMLTRCTRDLRYRFVSRAYAEMIGRTPEEVSGKPIVEIMGKEGLMTISPYIEKVLQGERVEYESEVSFEGAAAPFLHVVYTPDWAEDGQVIGWFASIVDISDRKRAEEALQASEQRFREIFETAGVSVWLEDFTSVQAKLKELHAQGVDDFRMYFLEHPDFVRGLIGLVQILDVNNETLDLFGARNKTELLGSLSNVFAPETEQIFVEELMALVDGQEMLRAETQVRTLDGRPVSVLFTVHFAPQTNEQSHVVVTLTDITERKQIEEALRLENERFMRFVDSNIVGILIGNSSGKVVLANDYYLDLLGLSRKDFKEGRVDWKTLTPPEWLPADEKAIRELRESGVCVPYEKEYIRTDGTRVPVYIANAMLPGPGEEIAAFVIDLTERKQAEEALRESETLYRTIARSIPGGGVYVVDEDMRYIVADGAVTEAFDLSREILEGHTVSEVFQGEQRARMIERLSRNFAGETVSYETEYKGRVYWTQQAPLRESVGQAIIVTLDITERKQAERALQESEERFRAILRQATAGIVRKDARGRLIFVNQAFCNMLGYTETELLGKTVWEFMHPSDVAENKRSFDRLMLEGVPFKLERRFLRQDGSIIWVDASVSPLMDPTGRPQSAVAVEVDITARKQAEEALQTLNLELEARVQERTAELLAMNESLQDEIKERRQVELALDESRRRLQILSQRLVEVQEEERRAIARELHDRVGQTLSALNINMIIMRDQLSPDSLERVAPRLSDSMHLVGETITLVRDVMSNLRPSVLDDYGLEAALQSHTDEFRARYGIPVHFHKPVPPLPRLGPSIEMTFLRIAQEALINIARHANASQVILSLWREGDLVYMTIQDNGSGIASWQQANRPGSHGLVIMRERAEAFGGHLEVSSLPGKGTKVAMSIPFGTDKQLEAQPEMRQ